MPDPPRTIVSDLIQRIAIALRDEMSEDRRDALQDLMFELARYQSELKKGG